MYRAMHEVKHFKTSNNLCVWKGVRLLNKRRKILFIACTYQQKQTNLYIQTSLPIPTLSARLVDKRRVSVVVAMGRPVLEVEL